MEQAPIFFDPQFTLAVMVGWVLTVAGAATLLLAALWFSIAGEWRRAQAAPGAFRAFTGVGLVLWLGGLLWQFVGYFAVGALRW